MRSSTVADHEAGEETAVVPEAEPQARLSGIGRADDLRVYPMKFVSKYAPEQWAEARRLRAEGMTFTAIAQRLGFGKPGTLSARARHEGWPDGSAGAAGSATPKPKPRVASPGTADTLRRLAKRLYRVIEIEIKTMELRMQKQLERLERNPNGTVPPAVTKDERESFAALIASINQVTEMASEPASAADGRRKSASYNPELTALSGDIEPDALAAASEKDELRREIADKLEKLVPPA